MKPVAALAFLLGCAAGAAAQERITIPAVASVVGASPFYSDVRVFNRSSSAVEVRATYRCFVAACPGTAPQETFTVAPRESRAFDDMIAETFHAPNSAGGVELDVVSGGTASDVVVTSRLYSTAPEPTVGMFVPGVGPGEAHQYGVLTQIANGGAGEGFRTNVGAFNPQDTAATVVFAVYWEGHWVGQVERTIPAHSGTQISNIFGSGGINHPLLETTDSVVTVQTNGPAIFSYAAVIDNHTTDPIFVRGAADSPPVLSVGGAYATDVALGQNTCTPVPTVMDNPTTVVQTPGSNALTLTHATITYEGTVDDDGSFAMQPESVGGQFTITITGQFTPQGFTASVRVDQAAPACFYIVDWNGLKDVGANFFP
jgi:hypothetical protein